MSIQLYYLVTRISSGDGEGFFVCCIFNLVRMGEVLVKHDILCILGQEFEQQ